MKQHDAPLFPIACCMMAGIVMSRWLADWQSALAALSASVVLTALLRRWAVAQTVGIYGCSLLLGMALGARQQQSLEVAWPQAMVEREAVVIGEPVVKARWVILDVLTATGHRKLRLRVARDADSERIALGDGLVVRTRINNKVRGWARDSVRQGQRRSFSYRRYMQCQGFVGEGFVGSRQWRWRQVSLSGLSTVERLRLRFLGWRHRMLEHYRRWGVSDDAYGVLTAMTLGEKTRIDAGTRGIYRDVGASHILALSGLHLMTIYGLVSLLVGGRRFGMWSQVVTVLAIWAFALLTGLSPSVTRAATMITVYALFSLGYRPKMSVNTLALTAIVMLIVNPLALYDVGFQLSFAAVLAIVLVAPLLYNLLGESFRRQHRLLAGLWGLAAVSVAAQVGTAPLVAYYFGYFSTVFLPTNYVVIPLATVVLYLAPLLLAVSWWPWAAGAVATMLSALVTLMTRLLGQIAAIPYCTVDGLQPSGAQVCLAYIVLGCLWAAVILRCPAVRRTG